MYPKAARRWVEKGNTLMSVQPLHNEMTRNRYSYFPKGGAKVNSSTGIQLCYTVPKDRHYLGFIRTVSCLHFDAEAFNEKICTADEWLRSGLNSLEVLHGNNTRPINSCMRAIKHGGQRT